MGDYNLQTVFLRRMLAYNHCPECEQIEKSIAGAQQDHACVLRAVWRVGSLAMISVLLSQTDFLQSAPSAYLNIVCVTSLAAIICCIAFIGVLVFYRLKLNSLREVSRRLIQQRMEPRAGPYREAPAIKPLHSSKTS